jgi:hypothetical protein
VRDSENIAIACLCLVGDLGSHQIEGVLRREIYLQWKPFQIAASGLIPFGGGEQTVSTITELYISEGAPLRHIFATHHRPGLPPLDLRRAAPHRLLGSWCLFEDPEPWVDANLLHARISAVSDFEFLKAVPALNIEFIQISEECIPSLNSLPDEIRLRALSSPEWSHLMTSS